MNDNVSENINWFPGHMQKTRRLIKENVGACDIVLELLDARIPQSSKNPEIDSLTATRPKLTLLNKCSLADPAVTKAWVERFRRDGGSALPIDCITGDGIGKIKSACASILSEKLEKYSERGMSGRKIRAMILGIPNVGKSSLVNRLSGAKKAKVEDRPGVTMTKQWVATSIGIDLLDMPGVLWPKFEDKKTGRALAFTGAIKDSILDTEMLAGELCKTLLSLCPDLFLARYKLKSGRPDELHPQELLEEVARARGFLISRGEPDTERAAGIVLDEFRGGKIGRITLEAPDGAGQEE